MFLGSGWVQKVQGRRGCCKSYCIFFFLHSPLFWSPSEYLIFSDCLSIIQEAERVSDKKWSPVVEIGYRGGIYRGRIQGGLPEGKVLCSCFQIKHISMVVEFVVTERIVMLICRVVFHLKMEEYMMACGAMGRDLAWVHSITAMVMFIRDHGGMMPCMARYQYHLFVLTIII